MIVRIMTEGQLEVADDALDQLNALDDAVESAVAAHDEEAFGDALNRLLDLVRQIGKEVPDEELVESDLVLPPPDASLAEVEDLLGADGFIPG
ncbi:PspA-associated protein PspAA [Mumia sp. DW29H23]|uniref:PspA-associated protein PspAA n=1 Tax=Mumia sp. DW29H23 TaxID=3421241 RepID=UPI003D69D8A9